MKETEFNYQDVIDLGFVRSDDMNDSQVIKKRGYDDFLVTKKLAKRISLDWCSITREVHLIRQDKESNILGRIVMKSIDQLKELIEFFNPSPPDGETNKEGK